MTDQTLRDRATFNSVLNEKSMFEVLQFAVHGVHAFTYPDVAFPGYASAPEFKKLPVFTPDNVFRGWGVRNLLGAIYLQFYWVVTSGEGITKCSCCGQIISYAPPVLETGAKGRKPRSNKEFCDSRCRLNYHYHNRIKPRR